MLCSKARRIKYISTWQGIREDTEFNSSEDKRVVSLSYDLKRYGLNEDDYADLKWENEPLEVFLNLEEQS